MTRLLLLVILASTPALATPPAEPWLACVVGRGGLDSPQDVYRGVAAALDQGDAVALRALMPDRCNIFRATETNGYTLVADAVRKTDESIDALAHGAQAFLALEHVQASTLSMEISAAPGLVGSVRAATPLNLRVRLTVVAAPVDGRWYLWAPPKLEADAGPALKRLGELMRDLGARLGAARGSAAVRIVDTWEASHGAELATLLAATQVIQRLQTQKLQSTFAEAMKAHLQSPEIGKHLESLGLIGGRWIGVIPCDHYIVRLTTCAEQLSDNYKTRLFSRLKDLMMSWSDAASTAEGRRSLEPKCQDEVDSAKRALESSCPGVW